MQSSQEQQACSADAEYEFVLLETDVLRPFREQAERENVPFDQLVNRYLADYGKETLQHKQQAAFAPPTQQAACGKPEKKTLSMPLKELHQFRDEIVFIPAPGAPKLPPRSKHPRWTRFKRSLRLTRQEKMASRCQRRSADWRDPASSLPALDYGQLMKKAFSSALCPLIAPHKCGTLDSH